MSPIRKRFGLRWKTSRPTLKDIDNLTDVVLFALIAICCLLAYGFVDAHDRAVEERISAERSTQQFANFLNGGTIVDQAGHFAARCVQLLEVEQ